MIQYEVYVWFPHIGRYGEHKLVRTFDNLFNNYKKIVEKFSIDEKKYLFSETAIEAYNLDKSLLKKN